MDLIVITTYAMIVFSFVGMCWAYRWGKSVGRAEVNKTIPKENLIYVRKANSIDDEVEKLLREFPR